MSISLSISVKFLFELHRRTHVSAWCLSRILGSSSIGTRTSCANSESYGMWHLYMIVYVHVHVYCVYIYTQNLCCVLHTYIDSAGLKRHQQVVYVEYVQQHLVDADEHTRRSPSCFVKLLVLRDFTSRFLSDVNRNTKLLGLSRKPRKLWNWSDFLMWLWVFNKHTLEPGSFATDTACLTDELTVALDALHNHFIFQCAWGLHLSFAVRILQRLFWTRKDPVKSACTECKQLQLKQVRPQESPW